MINQIFHVMSLHLGSYYFLSVRFRNMNFGQKHYNVKRHIMPICTVMRDVNLDLLWSCLPHFSNLKLLFSPLAIKSILWAYTSRLCKSCFWLNFPPLVLAFIDYSCLNQLLLYWFFILITLFFYYAIFYYALFLLCYFSWHSKEEVFLSHCLFILLYHMNQCILINFDSMFRWKFDNIKHFGLAAQWCLTLCHPVDYSLPVRDFPGRNTGVACHFFSSLVLTS